MVPAARYLALALLWTLLALLLACLSLLPRTTAPNAPNAPIRPVAVIYAGPSFHQEIVSVLSCAYHELGYEVTVYLHSGIALLNWVLPFSDAHLRKSKEFYGKCVDNWVRIHQAPIRLVANTSVLVFGTYPLKITGGQQDQRAFELLRQFAQYKKSAPVLLVTHRTDESLNNHTQEMESILGKSRIVYLFLANHTEQHARKYFLNETVHRTAHIYPVMPMHYLMDENTYANAGSKHPTFSVQGNFGGKHAHRKNTAGVVSCIRKLEDLNSQVDYSIDFIGKGDLNQQSLRRGVLRHLTGLSHTDFFRAIAVTRFLVPAIGESAYYFSRATSSVPAALIAHVPVATSRSFLGLYPCLRDSAMHRLITGETECETLRAASELGEEDYLALKDEAARCARSYWGETLRTLERLAQPSVWRARA